jgi:hypothetical protein
MMMTGFVRVEITRAFWQFGRGTVEDARRQRAVFSAIPWEPDGSG